MRMREWWLILESHAMGAFFIDVQVERHMVLAKRAGEHHCIFHRNGRVFKRRP